MDIDLTEYRQNLVDRYNASVGEPGPAVTALQQQFLTGAMDAFLVKQFVTQCEAMIESRNPMRRNAGA